MCVCMYTHNVPGNTHQRSSSCFCSFHLSRRFYPRAQITISHMQQQQHIKVLSPRAHTQSTHTRSKRCECGSSSSSSAPATCCCRLHRLRRNNNVRLSTVASRFSHRLRLSLPPRGQSTPAPRAMQTTTTTALHRERETLRLFTFALAAATQVVATLRSIYLAHTHTLHTFLSLQQ